MTQYKLEPKVMRDMLECHREYLLERAEQYPEFAKACRAVVDRERTLFAHLWNDGDTPPAQRT
jgi:hypothetical protein